jgi:predicted Fe-Mo cluster-binding NifX family protein
MRERKLAIPTREAGGMDDLVSDVFGRAKTFTILDIKGKRVERVEVMRNPAASYKHGAGPITVKTLKDKGVTTIAAIEFGPGVSTLIDQFNIERVEVQRDTPVADTVNHVLG